MVKENIQQSTPPPLDYLLFYVNGKQIIEHHAEPDWTLLWYLRNSRLHGFYLIVNFIIFC